MAGKFSKVEIYKPRNKLDLKDSAPRREENDVDPAAAKRSLTDLDSTLGFRISHPSMDQSKSDVSKMDQSKSDVSKMTQSKSDAKNFRKTDLKSEPDGKMIRKTEHVINEPSDERNFVHINSKNRHLTNRDKQETDESGDPEPDLSKNISRPPGDLEAANEASKVEGSIEGDAEENQHKSKEPQDVEARFCSNCQAKYSLMNQSWLRY